MKIGFVSQFDPADRFDSSGTAFKVAEQLSKIGELVWIKRELTSFGRWLMRIQNFHNRHVKRKKLHIATTKLGVKKCYSTAKSSHLIDEVDVLVCFFCSTEVYKLKTEKPIIYITDATFPAMIDYYPDFSNLYKFNQDSAIWFEKEVAKKAAAIIYSSDWAAKSSAEDLNTLKDKIHVIEFGANIDDKDVVENVATSHGGLDLLFLGVDWNRKGGDLAVKTVKVLNEMGIKTTLHIVGIRDLSPTVAALPYVDYIGFLNKNNPDEYKRLVDVVRNCNAMLLPTLNECSAIAFAESSAFGLPTFTHDTGGVSNYIENGVNGYMLPIGSTPDDFAVKIKESFESGKLEQMSVSSVELYKKKLNWDIWRQRVANVINHVIR